MRPPIGFVPEGPFPMHHESNRMGGPMMLPGMEYQPTHMMQQPLNVERRFLAAGRNMVHGVKADNPNY